MRYILIFLCLLLPLLAQSVDVEIILIDKDLEPATPDNLTITQGPDEYQRVPNNVIQSNDFERMRNLPVDSQDYRLGTKVGWFVIPDKYNPDRYRYCSGFLVGPDLFITARHCLYYNNERQPVEKALIFMDYYENTDIDRTRGGVTAGVSAVLHADADKDYALLRLDAPIGNTYGWLQLDTTTPIDSSQSVKIIQHPLGRSKEIVRHNSEIIDIQANHPLKRKPFALAYLADTQPGSSGAPVFLREGTGVIGIHLSGWTRNNIPDFNAGTRMSYIVPEIQQWLPSSDAIPDLAVIRSQLSSDTATPGETLTLTATVWNQGTAASVATTLRFYQSIDNTITAVDTLIGSVPIASLAPNQNTDANIIFTAPQPGTYNYGACVDAVSGDPRIDNDCSTTTMLTVTATPLTRMYWIELDGEIQRAYVDGSNIETLVTSVHGVRRLIDIDVDMLNRKMYWVNDDRNVIQRANLDGSHIEDVITGFKDDLEEYPNSIALDVAGGMIYYVGNNVFHRATLDGSHIESLTTHPDILYGYSRDIALNMSRGKMYWTGDSLIRRANLNGSDIEVLVTELEHPTNITLDVVGGKMYWTDSEAKKIQRSNLDGSNVEDLVTSTDGLVGPSGFALDVASNKMYWTDSGTDKIQRANTDGSNIENLITRGLDDVIGIALELREPQNYRPIQLSPNALANQSFKVNTEIDSIVMPVAHGGTPPYTYTLSPALPPGLQFDAVHRFIAGIPTDALSPTPFTYTATDAANADVVLRFTLEVIGSASPEPPPSEPPPLMLDVNGDGEVDVLDLVWVAMFYGKRGDLTADVNNDGIVNVQDFILVAEAVDAKLAEGIAEDIPVDLIEEALWKMIDNIAAAPSQTHTTALLPNYPNPFNPETWIPYTLSAATDVAIKIHATDGSLVRRLAFGHQPAGFYVSKYRAAYWDGRNQTGEPVASGLYFYTLTAGDFTATRKLLIHK